ncbi:MAG: hypothetical protein LC687_00900 [Actinobacteria bacterium]|nr:hypothetical protein [Actinomycetota bacterium]
MRPVIDLLTMELDLGIAKLMMIDMAYLKLPAQTVDTAKKVIQILKSTIEFIDAMDSVGGIISFGDFHLTGTFLEDPDSQATESELGANRAAPTGGNTSTETAAAGPDQKGLAEGSVKRFRLPILEDPSTALGLITGKPVDLFWYDLPDLDLEFEYRKTFPVYPGLNVGIMGSVGVETNFDFGFDTSGFIEFQESGYATSEIWRIMNGFYLDDHGLENTANDLDEVVLSAMLGAVASLGVGGLVEAGVIGGIEAVIGFDLNDKLTQFDNGDPIGDGKLYGAELIDRISHGPQCLFDVHGTLTLFLDVFLWIGIDLGFSEITIFEATERFVDLLLAEFKWECVHAAPEHIAEQSGDELKLKYYGDDSGGAHAYTVKQLNAEDNTAGWTIETLFRQGFLDFDFYSSTELSALSTRLSSFDGEDLLVVSTGQRVEVYRASDIKKITTLGTSADDHYRISNVDEYVTTIDLNTGAGNDLVEINLDDKNTGADAINDIRVSSGSGNDIVTVNGGVNDLVSSIIIDTGSDDDRVKISSVITASAIIAQGGSGNDSLRLDGEQSNYSLFGAFGGSGRDTIMGGDKTDFIYGDSTLDLAQVNAFVTAAQTAVAVAGAPNIAGTTLAGVQAQSPANMGGMDVILSYGGKDYVEGGDETVAIVYSNKSDDTVLSVGTYYASYDPELHNRVISVYYNNDGTPLAKENYMADGTLSAAGLLLDPDSLAMLNRHGDLISTGDGDDTVIAGKGFDTINGGKGANYVDAGMGDDVIDALESSGVVKAGDGNDVIEWLYKPGTSLTVDGGSGKDRLSATLEDQTEAGTDQGVYIFDNAGKAVLAVDSLPGSTPKTLAAVKAIDANNNTDTVDHISLTGVEALTLAMGDGKDTLMIDDVIGTDLTSIDVDAGSTQETMFLADRDADNNKFASRADNHFQYLPYAPAGASGVVLVYMGQEINVSSYTAAGIAASLNTALGLSDSHRIKSDELNMGSYGGEDRWILNLADLDLDVDNNANYELFSLRYNGVTELAATAVANGGLNAQQADYFYRASLASGDYKYDAVTGEPVLTSHYVPAVSAAGAQEIEIGQGLDRVTLYAGYQDNATINYGLGSTNTVQVYSWMSASEVQTVIDGNTAFSGITVTDLAGTTGGAWNFAGATDTLAYSYQTQDHNGVLYSIEDTRIIDTFYRATSFSAGTVDYLFNETEPVVAVESLLTGDSLDWAEWMAGATLKYGTESVSLANVGALVEQAQLATTPNYAKATAALQAILNDYAAVGDVKLVQTVSNGEPSWAISERIAPAQSISYSIDKQASYLFYSGSYQTLDLSGTDAEDLLNITSAIKALTGRDVTVTDDGSNWVFSVPGELERPLQSSTSAAGTPTPVGSYVYTFDHAIGAQITTASLKYNGGTAQVVDLSGDEASDMVNINAAFVALNIGQDTSISIVNGKWQITVANALAQSLEITHAGAVETATDISTYLGETLVNVTNKQFDLSLAQGAGSVEIYTEMVENRASSAQTEAQVRAEIEALTNVIVDSISITDTDPAAGVSWQIRYATLQTVALTSTSTQASITNEIASNAAINLADVTVTDDGNGNWAISFASSENGMQAVAFTPLSDELTVELPWQNYSLTSEELIFDRAAAETMQHPEQFIVPAMAGLTGVTLNLKNGGTLVDSIAVSDVQDAAVLKAAFEALVTGATAVVTEENGGWRVDLGQPLAAQNYFEFTGTRSSGGATTVQVSNAFQHNMIPLLLIKL